MRDPIHPIADLCVLMDKAQSRARVREIHQMAADAFGANFFMFGMRTGKTISPPEQIVISNYPEAWQRYYDEHGAFAFDPVIGKALQFGEPFRWDGLHSDERQLALRQESVRNGMEFGFSCTDRGPDASVAILSFSGNNPIALDPAAWEATASSASFYVATTHKALTRIVEGKAGHEVLGALLSNSERKSLEMMGASMTTEAAAKILKVRPCTVLYYLNRAAHKLGVATRKEAVMKAMAENIIDIRHFPNAGFGRDTPRHH